MKLKELNRGDLFTLKPYWGVVKDTQVYIKGEYDRTKRKFDCGRCDDISYSRFISGDTEVYTDFVF